jgi:hypothetical protein
MFSLLNIIFFGGFLIITFGRFRSSEALLVKGDQRLYRRDENPPPNPAVLSLEKVLSQTDAITLVVTTMPHK